MADKKKVSANGALSRLRVAAGIVLSVLITAMIFADLFAGSFGIRPDYHSEPIIFGSVLGGLLLILGIEIGSRWPWGGGS